MRINLLILSIFFLASFYTEKIQKSTETKIETMTICDSSKMESFYSECYKSYGIDTVNSSTYKKYYTDECRKTAKEKFCKNMKGVGFYKNGVRIKFIPCDSIVINENKKIRSLCE